jgi:hypothetical protein
MPKLSRTERETREATSRAKTERPAKVGKPGASAVTGSWLGQCQRLAGKGPRGGLSVPAGLGSCDDD